MKIITYASISLLWLTSIYCTRQDATQTKNPVAPTIVDTDSTKIEAAQPVLDTARYDSLMQYLANGDTTGKWPVKAARPLPGAILPFNRIIAYYGNLYSKRMGILGKLPKEEMLQQLKAEVASWQAADTLIPAIPALHYICVTAQEKPGKGGKYRLRMPFSQIDTVLSWAKEINALTFLDVQIGHSTAKAETIELVEYLKMPNVHYGIDPEFSMQNGNRPGTRIGGFHANDINEVIDILADLVKKNNIPPKILILHRFTQNMIRDYKSIKIVPEVQVVMDMDGFGAKALKRNTWQRYIYREPVQFTGFKIFYYNDSKGSNEPYTPQELLLFTPKPIYIQYQ